MVYPVPPFVDALLLVLRFCQAGLIAFVLIGDAFFDYLQVRRPPWFLTLRDNKLTSALLVLFVGNTVMASLAKTNAFEIFVHDGERPRLVFSKLDMGRMPTLHEVEAAMEYFFKKAQ